MSENCPPRSSSMAHGDHKMKDFHKTVRELERSMKKASTAAKTLPGGKGLAFCRSIEQMKRMVKAALPCRENGDNTEEDLLYTAFNDPRRRVRLRNVLTSQIQAESSGDDDSQAQELTPDGNDPMHMVSSAESDNMTPESSLDPGLVEGLADVNMQFSTPTQDSQGPDANPCLVFGRKQKLLSIVHADKSPSLEE